MLFKIILTKKEDIIQTKYSKTDDYKKENNKISSIYNNIWLFSYI